MFWFVRSLPLLFMSGFFALAQIGPKEAQSNLAEWASLLGIETWPVWATDYRVKLGATALGVIYGLVLLVRWFREKGKQSLKEPAPLPQRRAAAKIGALIDDRWHPEVVKFGEAATPFWDGARDAFADHGYPDDTCNPRTLDRRVPAAVWPPELDAADEDALGFDGEFLSNEMSAQLLREFCERLYQRGAGSGFESHRKKLSGLVETWWQRADKNDPDGQFADWLGENIGDLNIDTTKLLWYINEAHSAQFPDHQPDFRPYRFLWQNFTRLGRDTAAGPHEPGES